MWTLSHCIGVVEHSELAPVFTAHSIGFVTLWMLANPFFGFVGPAPPTPHSRQASVQYGRTHWLRGRSHEWPSSCEVSAAHGLFGWVVEVQTHRSSSGFQPVGVGLAVAGIGIVLDPLFIAAARTSTTRLFGVESATHRLPGFPNAGLVTRWIIHPYDAGVLGTRLHDGVLNPLWANRVCEPYRYRYHLANSVVTPPLLSAGSSRC